MIQWQKKEENKSPGERTRGGRKTKKPNWQRQNLIVLKIEKNQQMTNKKKAKGNEVNGEPSVVKITKN